MLMGINGRLIELDSIEIQPDPITKKIINDYLKRTKRETSPKREAA
jgi:hypothetical protein